jgi:hypothetical protein
MTKVWQEDIRLIELLDDLRQRGIGFMKGCYFCGAKSVAIKAVEEKLYSVCDKHN